MFGLGKKRSKFGKWIDKKGIKQTDLAKHANVADMTISRICNDPDYRPKISTAAKIKKAVKQLGHDVPRDFFDM
ncbi:helix-turn-helix transcriptional regulator [Metabacillus sp. Hm71]|uniref:helix-turn-helix transcriptional regulator n=1 Tax=Metabacillus sp. Hm71 TaxID=3450743 RepID=UPI003F43FA61